MEALIDYIDKAYANPAVYSPDISELVHLWAFLFLCGGGIRLNGDWLGFDYASRYNFA